VRKQQRIDAEHAMRLDRETLTDALEAGFYSARAPRIVEVLLAAAIAMQVWFIARTATDAPVASTAVGPAVLTPQSRFTPSDLSQLLGAHLFGEAPTASAPATPAVAPSAFKLVGLYVPKDGDAVGVAEPAFESPGDSDDETSPLEWARKFFGDHLRTAARPGPIAWLSLSGAPGQRVQVGDAIGGATVREIRDDGVTLELEGRRVRVAYPENPYIAMFRGESDQVTAVADSDSIPAELASRLLRFQPEQGSSGLTGFRLYPGSDAQAFVKSGLRAVDGFEHVAGAPITSARDLVPLLRAVRDSKAVQLRLRRASKPVDLRLFQASAEITPSTKPVRRSNAPPARPDAAPNPSRPLALIPTGATSP
jgi:hypothetical protein